MPIFQDPDVESLPPAPDADAREPEELRRPPSDEARRLQYDDGPPSEPTRRPVPPVKAGLPAIDTSRRAPDGGELIERIYSPPRTPASAHYRRPSLSSEVSPLHHASMVGSYEESILRGRMSTAPSKPLDFMAQIGVLGLGKCKPNLRCPAHVSVPFPAVFYSYGQANAGGRTPIVDDSPSPYVGLIDLENSLGRPREEKGRKSYSHPSNGGNSSPEDEEERAAGQPITKLSENELRLRRKKKRRSQSPKAPPGGSYRIPQTGQLQIVIKNPNRTAVKLFLVPYDLQDMLPGTKTFIRQRSYSTGPIMDIPLRSKTNESAPDEARNKGPTVDGPRDRPTLRYLIHLHICSPSRGRFYLYKGIRVVFANRVPDGNEKLRNEIQLPEPRYSAYKPGRESVTVHAFTPGGSLAVDRFFRRRSAGFAMSPGALDALDGIGPSPRPYPDGRPLIHAAFPPYLSGPSIPFGPNGPIISPFAYPHAPGMDTTAYRPPSDRSRTRPGMEHQRTVSWPLSPLWPSLLGSSISASRDEADDYVKLNRGDVGYGGHASGFPAGHGGDVGEGLLARRLKGLDVQRDPDRHQELPP